MLIPISTDHAETHRAPVANLVLVVITCVVSVALMGRLDEALVAALAAHGDPLALTGGFAHLPLIRGHQRPLQLIGHTLLHVDGWHLVGNMVVLLALGNPVNARLGHLRYLVLYGLSAVAGAPGWLILGDGGLVVGASGAVSGVMAAFLVLFPLTRVHTLLSVTGLALGAIALVWKVSGLGFGSDFLAVSVGTFVVLLIVSLRSLAEHSPPEGALLRAMGFWSLPVAGLWVVLFFLGLDVAAVALGVRGQVAHEAHVGGALGGLALAGALAALGLVRGTREDPTLLELVGLREPAPAPRPATQPAGRAPGLPLPPTRRYTRRPELSFSDYARLRQLEMATTSSSSTARWRGRDRDGVD